MHYLQERLKEVSQELFEQNKLYKEQPSLGLLNSIKELETKRDNINQSIELWRGVYESYPEEYEEQRE